MFVYIGEICWKLLQKSWFRFLFIFFGWRLCVVDVCVCAYAREFLTRLVALTSLSLPFRPFHQYMDTEPRLKPPAADWTVLFSIVFFLFIFFRLFLLLIFGLRFKRQANEGLEKTLYYSRDFCFVYISLSFYISEAKLKSGEIRYTTLVRCSHVRCYLSLALSRGRFASSNV